MTEPASQTATMPLSHSRLRPSPAVQHAIRYGCAASFALWLAYAAGLPQPTWPLITVLMVAQPTPGGSIQKGLLRMVGSVLAGFVSILIYGLVAQTPLLLTASLCVVYGLGIYVMTGPRHGYAGNVFAFTTGTILGNAFTHPTQQVEIVAFERVTLVLIGLVVSMIAEAVFWPERTQDRLRQTLGKWLREIANALRERPTSEAPSVTAARLPARFLDVLNLLDQIPREIGVRRERVDAYMRLTFRVQMLETALRSLEVDLRAARGGARLQPPAALGEARDAFMAELGPCVAEAARTIGRSDGRRASRSGERESEALARCWARLDAGCRLAVSSADAAGREWARRAAPGLARIHDLAAGLAPAVAATERDGLEPRDPGRRDWAGRLWSPRRVDPLRVEMALRGAMSIAALIVLMPLFGWQASATQLTIAYLLASLPTRASLAQTVVGLLVVALGTWMLADLAIVYVVPHIPRMPLALLIPFLVTGFAGWAVVARPKLAPIAPMAGLIVLLSIFGGPQPPHDVMGPYVTTWTFFTAIAVGITVQRLLWPRTASELFRRRTAELLSLSRSTYEGAMRARPGDVTHRSLADVSATQARIVTTAAQLHAQADVEPTIDGLDVAARTDLLAQSYAVADAALDRVAMCLRPASARESGEPRVAPLHMDADEALALALGALATALAEARPAARDALAVARRSLEAHAGSGPDAERSDSQADTAAQHLDVRERMLTRLEALCDAIDRAFAERSGGAPR